MEAFTLQKESSKSALGSNYRGVDVNALQHPYTRKLDYRTQMQEIMDWCISYQPKMVTSLFSSECTANSITNTSLYLDIFERWGCVDRILVSGFYYLGKEDQAQVLEGEDIVSWQTLPSTPLINTKWIKESRLIIPAPSTMFGPDVIEVWRLLEFRGDKS